MVRCDFAMSLYLHNLLPVQALLPQFNAANLNCSWPFRLSVRARDFHSRKLGSTPSSATSRGVRERLHLWLGKDDRFGLQWPNDFMPT